jgi:hypothetical protein
MNNKLIFIFILSFLFITCGSSPDYGDFNIYQVLDQGIPYEGPTKPIDSLTLSNEPIISIQDITSYSWQTHDFIINSIAHSILDTLGAHHLVSPFVACVGNDRIYYGCFISMVSSYMPTTYPYILIKTDLQISKALNDTIIDRRNDIRIYNSIKQSGKLIE